MLLAESKLKNIIIKEKLATLPPLSLEYDQLSLFTPYSTRVNGALLALAFFSLVESGDTDFLSTDSTIFLQQLVESAKKLQKKGLEANQIFMLIFNESINQSIISESGVNYEERILSVLTDEIGIAVEDIQKTHDDNDASTEYDFFFRLNNRSYGISAKKTLRERYKQFIKTANTTPIDIMIEITLGVDLTLEKAKTIRDHDVYIFVADEIYSTRKNLQQLEGVYSVVDFTKQTLVNL